MQVTHTIKFRPQVGDTLGTLQARLNGYAGRVPADATLVRFTTRGRLNGKVGFRWVTETEDAVEAAPAAGEA